MYCSKCGKFITDDQFRYSEDGQILCIDCAEGKTPEGQQPDFSVGDTSSAPKKNKKTGMIAAVAAVLVVAVAAVAIFLNMDAVENFWNNTFASPEEYMITVEDKALSEMVDSLTSTPVIPNKPTTNGTSTTVQVTLSEQVLTLVDTALAAQGMTIDHSFLSDIRIKLDSNELEDASSSMLALLLGDQQILSVQNIATAEAFYLAFPDLSQTFITGPAEEAPLAYTSVSLDLISDLPEGEVMNEIALRYIPTLLDALKDVTKTKETLELNGAQQNVTALTAKLTPQDLLDLMTSLLDQLETDEEALSVLYTIATNIGLYYGEETPQDMLSDLRASLEEATATDAEGNLLLLTTYVDGRGDVAGRKLMVVTDGSEYEVASFITVTEGETTHRNLTVDDQTILESSGTETDGTFDLYIDGEKLISLEYRDYVNNEKKLSGTFVLTPYDSNLAASTLMLGGTPSFAISLDNTQDQTNIEVSINAGSNTLATLRAISEATTVDSIQIPTDVADVYDDAALNEYFESLNFNQLLDNLSAANVPEELVDAVEMLLSTLLYYAY